jgi:APA family basic amino acid/polyamine antiporter
VGDLDLPEDHAPLQRQFGLLQATALNVTMIVGAGVFVTIPLMLKELPGPYALLGWLAAGALMIIDGMIWSELGAALPGSGGSYLYLLESYGRERWGRLMAFLFIWQFLLSGPLEVASGLIAMGQFATAISPELHKFNQDHTATLVLGQWQTADKTDDLTITVDPVRLACFALGVLLLLLLYRKARFLGKMTVTFWLGVLGVIIWILIEGAIRFDPARAFDFTGAEAAANPAQFWRGLGAAMILAMYSYLGYYNVCYIGDEVRDPGKTIPRSILLTAVLVCLLFVGLHLAMLGTISWREVPTNPENYSLPAEFMGRIHGRWAVILVTVLLIWTCAGSAFAALLGYSRIPYGAARFGHFFAVFGRVHPRFQIPHVSLLLIGGLTLFWSFFGLESVINALIATRILEQFVGQIVGVMLLRKLQPDRPRPYRIWLYPLPCLVALVGWLFMYVSAGVPYMVLGGVTLMLGAVTFFAWSAARKSWPFETRANSPS